MEITQEQYNEIIRGQAETQSIVKSVDQKLGTLMTIVEQNRHAIYGHNGTPGLLSWQQSMEASRIKLETSIDNVTCAIYGDPANREDPGIRGEITDLKDEL